MTCEMPLFCRILKGPLIVSTTVLAGMSLQAGGAPMQKESRAAADKMAVAVVQFRSSPDLGENVRRHCEYVLRCAKDGARVVVFPECSVTGYTEEAVAKAAPEQLRQAESAVAEAAKEAKTYVIVGIPTKKDAAVFNSAVVFGPDGKLIERYHKVQLAEDWATPGDHMSVFPIDGALCSIIICHDERYPELVRLPVLAGARIVFYISHESGMTKKGKIEPYRAQIVARAVENTVFVVQANAPGDRKTLAGSHGQSRIINPDGKIICEAGIFDEETLQANLDLGNATGKLAEQSLRCDFLKSWWEEGAGKVRRVELTGKEHEQSD